jgi:hypothetical protein
VINMTASPPAGDPITVILIPDAQANLTQLQERTNLSATDLMNRAITLYEFIDAQLRADRDVITRDNETGTTMLVQLLDAPGGQAQLAGSAYRRRSPAGRRRGGRPPPSTQAGPSGSCQESATYGGK